MIISVANQKGGVGKTTTSLNLGVFLAKKGKKVCLLDLDPQSNLTSGLGYGTTNENLETKNMSIYDILIEDKTFNEVLFQTRISNLSLVPSSIELAGAEIELVNMMSRESTLKRAIEPIRHAFDVILIDCPPSLGLLTINALTASHRVLIPIQSEYFALEGLGQLLNSIKLVKTKLNPELKIGGIVMTMYDARTNLSKQVTEEVQKVFGDKIFNTIIPRNIRLSEAPSHGQSIMEYDITSQGAEAYENLAKEVLERL